MITDETNGFSVSGINASVPFRCPENFEGPLCKLKPLCTSDDGPNAIKLLRLEQFDALQMYGLATPPIAMGDAVGADRGDTGNKHHPRLRVRCDNERGDYTLISCDDNMIVDPVTETCKPYDVCVDHVSGYKHRYAVNELLQTSLDNDQRYYVCDDGKSVLHTCDEGTAFSVKNSGCVSKSECYGRGVVRLTRDENSYVQCAGDTGIVHKCEYGVAVTDGFVYCKVPNCVPTKYYYTDDVVSYAKGEIWCDDGVEHKVVCSNKNTDKKYKYSWGTDFSFDFPTWPEEVYDPGSRVCKKPDDSIIKPDASVRFRWGTAMMRYWPFDPRTEQFRCDQCPRTAMRIDYKNEVTIPPVDFTKHYVDFTTPCLGPENWPRTYAEYFVELYGGTVREYLHNVTTYGPKPGGMPMVYGVQVDTAKIDVRAVLEFFAGTARRQPNEPGVMWPTVLRIERLNTATGEYVSTKTYYTFGITKKSRKTVVDVRASNTAPLGFMDPVNIEIGEINLLVYRNWPSFVPPNDEPVRAPVKSVYFFMSGDRIAAQH